MIALLNNKKGTVMIITIVVAFLIIGISYSYFVTSLHNIKLTESNIIEGKAIYAAEAGVAHVIQQLTKGKILEDINKIWDEDLDGTPDVKTSIASNASAYTCSVQDLGTDEVDNDDDGNIDEADEKFIKKIISRGFHSNRGRILEVIVREQTRPIHDLFFKAIYSGNKFRQKDGFFSKSGFQLFFGGQSGGQADVIKGNVYSNGDIKVTGSANIIGGAEATGSIIGGNKNNITGDPDDNLKAGGNANANLLLPPDLIAMDYEKNADVFVSKAFDEYSKNGQLVSLSNFRANGNDMSFMNSSVKSVPESDPAHIFATGVLKSSGFGKVPADTTNQNFFLGDWHNSGTQGFKGNLITVNDNGNDLAYFVDGNLWVEINGASAEFGKRDDGTRITVVVKGNIYISDDIKYSAATANGVKLDGLALIAMTDKESFIDGTAGKNSKNNRFDAGETLINDDGDGVYEGNKEGSGNVLFGDPNANSGAVTVESFIYAENNFVDSVVDSSGKQLPFTLIGLMSGGGTVDLNRDFGGQHASMKVTYDARLENGSLSLPLLPEGSDSGITGTGVWQVLSIRELSRPELISGSTN